MTKSLLLACLCCAVPSAAAQQIGSPFTIRSSPTISRTSSCDVAYDVTRDVYAVVYRRLDGIVRVQRLSSTGRLLGGEISIGRGEGRIANISSRNRFVVVYQRGSTISARIVDPASGALSNPLTVTTSSDATFAVGGEATTVDDDIVVVWARNGQIIGAQVSVSSTFQLSRFGERTIGSSGAQFPHIVISTSGGSAGRYLVAWEERANTVLRGAIITRNIGLLDTFLIDVVPSGQRGFVTGADGDGGSFVVGYQHGFGVFARGLTLDPLSNTTAVGPERVIEADSNRAEELPTVAHIGASSLIAYRERTSGSDFYAKSVDPFSCQICEPQFDLDTPNGGRGEKVESISDSAAGGSGERVFIAWLRHESVNGTSVATIRGRFVHAEDGIATDRGGGCGAGGTAFATCARHGHSPFEIRVRGALFGNGILVISPRRIGLPCGSCELVPDPAVGVVVLTQIAPSGAGSVAIPLPASNDLIGARFFAQWLVLQNAGACSQLPGHFSNALEVEIQ